MHNHFVPLSFKGLSWFWWTLHNLNKLVCTYVLSYGQTFSYQRLRKPLLSYETVDDFILDYLRDKYVRRVCLGMSPILSLS